jgi:NAD(P)H dehydrogenase (quinone)
MEATIREKEPAHMTVRVAVIYYSATGNVHALASAMAEGAKAAGADVRLRRVHELAPDTAIDANPQWRAHVDATKDSVPEAALADLEWANAYAFGSPTRFGNVTAQLKQFIDQTGGLWQQGLLADKPATSFTSSANRHGGQESTILSLNNVFYHWGCLIVPPGYTDPLLYASGGNPYGVSWPSGAGAGPDEATLEAARYQGRRLADFAGRLSPGAA